MAEIYWSSEGKEYESTASDHSRSVVSMDPVTDQTCEVTVRDLHYHTSHQQFRTAQKHKSVLI